MPATYRLQLDWSKYLSGGNGNDYIKGTAASEVINGRDGNDTYYGGGGDDVYIVGSTGDKIIEYGGQGNDAVISWTYFYELPDNVENLQINAKSHATGIGNALDNVILGGVGGNTIKGAGGDDVIIGGAGADKLYGGDGRDIFVYQSANEGMDTIYDYEIGSDSLDFSGFLSDSVNAEAVTSAPKLSSPVTKQVKEVTYVPVTTSKGKADLKYDLPIDYSKYKIIDLDHVSTRGSIKLGANENVLFLGPDKPWSGDQIKVIGGNHVGLIGGTFKPTSNSGPTTLNFDDFRGSLYIEGVEIDNSKVGYRDGLRFGGKNGTRPDVIIQNSSIENIKGAKVSSGHGDIIQPLGPVGDIKIYNFTGSTTYQGLFFSNQPHKSGASIKGVDLENVNLKYNGGSKSYILWLEREQDVDLKNVWVEQRSGYSAQKWSVWPAGGSRHGDTVNLKKYGFDGEVKVGRPNGGDFVKSSDAGAGYQRGKATKTEYKEVVTYKTVVVDQGDSNVLDASAGSNNKLKFIQDGENTIVYADQNGNGNYEKLITLKDVDAKKLAASYNGDGSAPKVDNQPDYSDPVEPEPEPTPDPAPTPEPEPEPQPEPPKNTGGDGPVGQKDIPNLEKIDPDNWLHGNSGKNDTISGTSKDDWINGRGGDDVMSGKGGDDVYVVNTNDDRIVEGVRGGTDLVISWAKKYDLDDNVENARLERSGSELVGNELDNTVLGSFGANRIFGEEGDDILIGGLGNDTLEGGSGSDVFVYEQKLDGGDTILDFKPGTDVIDLRALDIEYSNVQVKNASGDAKIYAAGTLIATLEDVNASQVDPTQDFWL